MDTEVMPESWAAAALRKIEGMQEVHRQQRRRLESDIEGHPAHASYSNHLMGLIQREEDTLAQGGNTTTLASRVEAMLAAETENLFKLQAQQNQDRRKVLFRRQEEHRNHLCRQVKDELGRHEQPMFSSASCPSNDEVAATLVGSGDSTQRQRQQQQHHPQQQRSRRGSKGQDFRTREAAMRATSAAQWAENEAFHLKNAFGLQLRRLEVDWANHTVKVGADYESRRASLEARRTMSGRARGANVVTGRAKANHPSQPPPPSLGSSGHAGANGGGGDTPWRSREKQSRLIHTAPVFQPDSGRVSSVGAGAAGWSTGGARGEGHSGSKGVNTSGGCLTRAVDKELEQLDEAYLAVETNVRAQKKAAQTWIRRQRIRMEAQIEATAEERVDLQDRLTDTAKEEAELVAMAISLRETISTASSVQKRRLTSSGGGAAGAMHEKPPT